MSDTLFVKFYTENPGKDRMRYALGNGFSDTHDLCKNKGDIIWVKHVNDKGATEYNDELPISKGTVYVSALFVFHLNRVNIWAKKYPNINFIVGGPAVPYTKVIGKLPSNITLTNKSVEEWFGVDNFSYKWKFEVPDFIEENNVIFTTYMLNNFCYWNKCTFCSHPGCPVEVTNRIRKNIDFEFKDIEYNGKTRIVLGTQAILPEHINNVLPNLPRKPGRQYQAFIKADKPQLKEFKKQNLNDVFRDDIKYTIGIEFPSNRMWKRMRKGYDRSTVLEFINLIVSHESKVSLSFIVGWKDITQQDVDEAERFFQELAIPCNDSISNFEMHELLITPYSKLDGQYNIVETISAGPFLVGYVPTIGDDKISLNLKYRDIILKYADQKNYRVENRHKKFFGKEVG
jgi:hypothetical protein